MKEKTANEYWISYKNFRKDIDFNLKHKTIEVGAEMESEEFTIQELQAINEKVDEAIKSTEKINKLKNRLKADIEIGLKELKNQLYENLDNQRIKELSKKYNIKIKIVETLEIICFNFKKSYLLKVNNKLIKSEINNKHEYIQSREFERDIKAFLYKSNKGGE